MPEQQISYQQFLKGLQPERKREIELVWRAVRKSIAGDFKEVITPKFLTFKAEDELYVALANQKNYISLYLMPLYVYPELKTKLDEGPGKLKHGKSCINFKKADELPLSIIGEIIAANTAADYLKKVRGGRKSR